MVLSTVSNAAEFLCYLRHIIFLKQANGGNAVCAGCPALLRILRCDAPEGQHRHAAISFVASFSQSLNSIGYHVAVFLEHWTKDSKIGSVRFSPGKFLK